MVSRVGPDIAAHGSPEIGQGQALPDTATIASDWTAGKGRKLTGPMAAREETVVNEWAVGSFENAVT